MPEETSPLKIIKVAAVLDRLTIVINQGRADDVKTGDRFLVYALGDEILDPDTGLSLGQLEIIKGTGRAVHVQLEMATISSDMKSVASRTIRKETTGNAFRALAMGLGSHSEEVLPAESVPFEDVEIGDTVRKIIDR